MSDQALPQPVAAAPKGLLARAAQGLRALHLGATAIEQPDPLAGLRALLGSHASKLTSATEAINDVRSGDHVFVGTACATPRHLVAALEAGTVHLPDVEMLHFLTDHAVPHDAQGQAVTRFRHRSFFVGADIRAAVKQGLAEYVPLSIARLPLLIALGRVKLDVALIQVSLPDAFGYVSLGVSVDVIPAAVAKARLVIAEINPQMPRTQGDSLIHLSQIEHLVLVDTPVIEYQHPATASAAMEQIARYIGGIIEDGSTLQMGLGRVTHEAMKHLADRRDIGIHTDVITDAIIALLEQGIVTGQRKTQQVGKIVTSFAMGSRRLYELIDNNPQFSFQPMDVVGNPQTIAAQHKMVSVTQAFAIDLTGQVCADQLDGDFYSGLAAQTEFLRGAALSAGGKPIICLASTDDDGNTSRIRAVLQPGEGATVARTDVHYVITEFGIAYLFGKSIRERAVALIEVAHPKFRAQLFEEAKSLGYIPAGQTLKNMRAYPVHEEVTVALKDQRQVLLRPAGSADGDAIRDLFHQLPKEDVVTRFFHTLRSLSAQQIQRLCNLNRETEMAFVACTGAREDATIVAQACYVIDPTTNLAETAFMVHPQWQGSGLGTALQKRMVSHAQSRGVRGFVAEILPNNRHMIRLASGGSSNVSVTREHDTVKVTALF